MYAVRSLGSTEVQTMRSLQTTILLLFSSPSHPLFLPSLGRLLRSLVRSEQWQKSDWSKLHKHICEHVAKGDEKAADQVGGGSSEEGENGQAGQTESPKRAADVHVEYSADEREREDARVDISACFWAVCRISRLRSIV